MNRKLVLLSGLFLAMWVSPVGLSGSSYAGLHTTTVGWWGWGDGCRDGGRHHGGGHRDGGGHGGGHHDGGHHDGGHHGGGHGGGHGGHGGHH